MQVIEFVNGQISTEVFTKQIKKKIDTFRESPEYRAMINGIAYYRQENIEIMSRRKTYYSESRHDALDDPYKANHKLPAGFMKEQADQKVNYSVNEKLDITDTDLRIELSDIGIEASIKAKAYMQFFEENKELKYKIIPAEQCVPVYQANQFVAMIREYILDNATYVAVYTSEIEIVFVVEKDQYRLKSILPIMSRVQVQDGMVVSRTPLSWGIPPFAIMKNNMECRTDLAPIKAYIDVYDLTNSDFANNIDDFQDAYWKLKGFGGEDLDEYMAQVKRFKTIIVGDDGDAGVETVQIPTEARKIMLDILERNIYKFGMAVNYDTITGSTTATEIKARTMNLDLKANAFEKEYRNLLEQFEFFINTYNSFVGKGTQEPIVVKFSRSTIVNRAEEVESLVKFAPFISKQTLFELAPYGIDVEEEMKRLKAEQKEREDSLGGTMGFEGDE